MAYQLFDTKRPYCPPTPHRNDPQNILVGVQHRIGRAKPYPSGIDLNIVDQILDDFFPLREKLTMSFDEWIETTQYPRHRKEKLTALRRRIDEGQISIDWNCDIFIKAECYDRFKFPRIISARSDSAKVILGPIFRPIEDYVFEQPWFIKHIPVRERAKYIVDHFGPGDYTYIVNDHTSFEVHAHTTFSAFEFRLYERLLTSTDFAKLRPLLGLQNIRTRGYSGRVASRMSGEMNTSLGNGLANFLSFAYLMYEAGAGKDDIKCIIEGDDAIFAVPKQYDHAVTEAAFSRIGFVVVMERHRRLGHCGFCSTYFADDGTAVVVEPLKAYTRLPISFSRPHGRVNDLRFSKALSCAVEYRGVPILQALGQRLLREYPQGKFICTDWYERQLFEHDHPSDPIPITEDARNMYFQMFNIDGPTQEMAERWFETCPTDEIFCNPYIVVPDEFYAFAQEHEIRDRILDSTLY